MRRWLVETTQRLPAPLALRARLALARVLFGAGGSFVCPVCAYRGPFSNGEGDGGMRRFVHCLRCGSGERQRLQHVVLQRLIEERGGFGDVLHIAPEPTIATLLRGASARYIAGDLEPRVADGNRVDITQIPHAKASFDTVFASHVLEHVPDDRRALMEVRRVLRPGGIAILPVPILGEFTVEYPEPNPLEAGHVRAPGRDYFGRYRAQFARVDVISSEDVRPEFQTFLYEDRTRWPSRRAPHRVPSPGERHSDFVPICHA